MDKTDIDAAGEPGISGRKLTTFLVAALILVGATLSYLLWSYSRVDEARHASEQSWRSLAEVLSQRYQRAELVIANGVDDGSVDMALGERFRLALDRFRTSAQPSVQYSSALKIEELLAGVRGLGEPAAVVVAAVNTHNERLEEQQRVLSTWGAKLLSIVLNFDQPPSFEAN